MALIGPKERPAPYSLKIPVRMPRPGTALHRAPARPEVRGHELPLTILGLVLLVGAPFVEQTFLAPDDGIERSPLLGQDFGTRAGQPFDAASGVSERASALAELSSLEEGIVTPLDGKDSTLLMRPVSGGWSGEGAGSGGAPAETASQGAAGSGQGGEGQQAIAEKWRQALAAAKSGAAQAARTVTLPRSPGGVSTRLGTALSKVAGLERSGGASSGASSPNLSAPSSSRLVSAPRVADSFVQPRAPGGFRGATGLARGTGGLLDPNQRSGAYFDRSRGAQSLMSEFNPSRPESPGGQALPASVQAQNTEAILRGAANPGGGSKTTPTPVPNDLATLMRKLELERKIALKYDKKRYDQLERKKMIEQIATQTLFQTSQQVLLKLLDKALESGQGGQKQGANSGNR